MIALGRRRTRRPAVLDLLPWDGFVAEGVLRNIDGALAATFEFRGPDLDSATAGQIEALSASVARAIDPLGDGWMIHLMSHRLPAPGYPPEGAFPDPFTRAVDCERRMRYEAGGERFESRYSVTLTHRPPVAVSRGWRRWSGGSELGIEAEERRIDAFESQVGDLEELLRAHLSVRRCCSREMLAHLYRSLSFRHTALNLPDEDHPVTLEYVLGAAPLHLGYKVRVGETHVVPVAVAGFPGTANAASLAFFNELAFPFHVSLRYLPLDRYTAKSAIGRKKTHWASASVRLRDLLASLVSRSGKPAAEDPWAKSMQADAEAALVFLDRHETTAGYLTTTFLAFDRDEAKAHERAAAVRTELQNRGFVAWIERLNAAQAFLGALPAVGAYNCRRPLVVTRTFVDLALTSSVWPGSPTHPHTKLASYPAHVVTATSGSTPFFLNLCHGDVSHALILGPTGAGKSVLVNLLAHQFLRYPEAQVLAIDKGWSLYGATRAAGGCHYPLSPEQGEGRSLRFAPLGSLESGKDRLAASAWLQELLTLQGLELTPEVVSQVNRGLDLLATAPSRTLSTFASKVQSQPVRDALSPYIGTGPLAHLFDGSANPLRSGHLHVFEMDEVVSLQAKAVVPLVLHLFSEIERRLDGRPTLILVEEALQYLGQTLWSAKFGQWLFQLRKANAGVVFVGQSLGAFLASSLKDAVLESCPTRIFLPNAHAEEPSAAKGYRAFGLNRRQIELLARATPRREYYCDSPAGSRLFELDLSPGALAVYRLAGPEGRRRVEELVTSHGEDWLAAYLEEEGQSDFAALIEQESQELSRKEITPC